MAKCVLAAMKDSSENGNSVYGFENFMTFEGNIPCGASLTLVLSLEPLGLEVPATGDQPFL